ncbi:MAG: hypothetical protein AAF569_00060 [Pseudomonadota bacterium]
MEFNSSLVREKFVISATQKLENEDDVVALSNRMVVAMYSERTGERESFVVRAQNMHSCVRFAAMIVKEFQDSGPIMVRRRKFYWQDLWQEVIKGYERDWNPDIWGVVYHKGRIVFEEGEHHAFLDIIEQCDAANNGKYKESIEFAEEAFKKAGKDVHIEYDSNIALVVAFKSDEAKCGVILRSANRTTTFNFTAKKKPNGSSVRVSQSLTVSAAFLEGIQLAFQAGMYNKKKAYKLIEQYSDDDRKGKRTVERVGSLNRAINKYEMLYDVTYRPERPNFSKAIIDAEEVAHTILAPQIQEMIESGEQDQGEWVD